MKKQRQRSIEVTVIRHAFHDADGAIHRRRVEVMQLVDDGSRVIIPPVDMVSIPHQQGGSTYTGRFRFLRRANQLLRVGGTWN